MLPSGDKGDRCAFIVKQLLDAIKDEKRAGSMYRELADDAHEMFCGGTCVKGFLAKLNLQGISMDEDKHNELLEQVLAAVEEECEETAER